MKTSLKNLTVFSFLILAVIILAVPDTAFSQTFPKLSVELGESETPADLSATMQILLIITIMALAPSIVIMVTSFIRMVVVFSFLRHALGTSQMPPNQLLVGLALILTFFLMSPIFNEINTNAIQPYLDGEFNQEQAYEEGIKPLRIFMLKQVREKDLELFVHLSGIDKPQTQDDIPTYVLIPGFVTSELRIAFQIGFTLFIPFLIIDMVVASVLMSMGMLMLPPIMVSLPFKILLFVLVDGWYLVIKSIVSSFR
ncbi:MAG: flagellar type III secretion system pore protein FliP [candidate division Zixibacteria bacterium]|nr:flagellar type III secretion system pore protein FliP [candidate division Zixibacteria bacterium]